MSNGLLLVLAILAGAPTAAASTLARPLPGLALGSLSLEKSALTISYNLKHRQADWVFYGLSARELQNCVQRTNRFSADEAVPTRYAAQLTDYAGSGYDRGHLSPAADNKFSPAAMNESFLLSNVSPQPSRFNRGIWARLENLVRAWAIETGGVWVTTGPVLEDHLSAIGSARISIPRYFYKVLVTKSGERGIGFLIPTNAHEDLPYYALSIDEVEQSTGLNFNQGIPHEDEIEAQRDTRNWNFRASYTPRPCRRR